MKLLGWFCIAAIFFSVSASTAQGAGEIVIKVATLAPQGSEWHKILQEMGAEWQKASNGRIVFRLYPGGVTGDDQDIVRKMRLGTLDAGLLTIGGLSYIDRGVIALEVPMAYADYDELDCVSAQIGPQLERRIEAKGFVVLGWTDGGWAHFFTRSPVRTPDDLKKLKMYVGTGDDQYVELVKRAGFNPVPAAFQRDCHRPSDRPGGCHHHVLSGGPPAAMVQAAQPYDRSQMGCAPGGHSDNEIRLGENSRRNSTCYQAGITQSSPTHARILRANRTKGHRRPEK